MNIHAPLAGGVNVNCFLCDLRRHIESSRRQVNLNPKDFIDPKDFIERYMEDLGVAFRQSTRDQDPSEFMKYIFPYNWLFLFLFIYYVFCNVMM